MSYAYLALILGAFLTFAITLGAVMWWSRRPRTVQPQAAAEIPAETASATLRRAA